MMMTSHKLMMTSLITVVMHSQNSDIIHTNGTSSNITHINDDIIQTNDITHTHYKITQMMMSLILMTSFQAKDDADHVSDKTHANDDIINTSNDTAHTNDKIICANNDITHITTITHKSHMPMMTHLVIPRITSIKPIITLAILIIMASHEKYRYRVGGEGSVVVVGGIAVHIYTLMKTRIRRDNV